MPAGANPSSGGQEAAPYLDALVAYAERDPGRFHIPGHKGGPGADPGLSEAISMRALALDIPALVEGIDAGPEPTPFSEAQRLAAEAWGARRSWFLVNGATQGNHAACFALAHRGERVLVQRNVHSSTIDGLILAGLSPSFVAPEVDPELGIAHCPTTSELEAALKREPEACGVIVVSPTYFGRSPTSVALPRPAMSGRSRLSWTRRGGLICASAKSFPPPRWGWARTWSSPVCTRSSAA
jgi:arginine decarboxylase